MKKLLIRDIAPTLEDYHAELRSDLGCDGECDKCKDQKLRDKNGCVVTVKVTQITTDFPF